MAIKQFYLHAIPYYSYSIKIDDEINRIDQLIEVARSQWMKKRLDAEVLVSLVDCFIPRSSWSDYEWKYNDGVVDNDAMVDVEDGFITTFSFRSDLTESNLLFLRNMLSICEDLKLNVFTANGDISCPPYYNINELIKRSSNFKYLSNPSEFIKNLDRNNSIRLPCKFIKEEE